MKAAAARQTGSKKQVAEEFLRLAASVNVREAYAKYVAPHFRHHNPHFRGDAESLMLAMEENARNNPGKALEIKQSIEEDDLVAVHSKVKHGPTDPGYALVHIFRFENGLIAELWDLAQSIPQDSPNQYGMF